MTQYEIAMPEIDEDTYQFSISVVLPTTTMECVFRWLNSVWNLFVTFPDGSIREAGVYPNAISWKGFSDYWIVFTTDYTSIGRLDIGAIKMFILDVEE